MPSPVKEKEFGEQRLLVSKQEQSTEVKWVDCVSHLKVFCGLDVSVSFCIALLFHDG